MEDDFIEVRATVDGNRKVFLSHNLVAAQFHHATSRYDDPQLHTHVVMLNASKFANKWRAILEKKLYDNVQKIGLLYRNNLATRLQALGYQIEQISKDFIRVRGYTDEQMAGFSQRRNEIVQITGKDASLKTKRVISLKLRPKKSNIPLSHLVPQWQQKAQDLGVVHPAPDLTGQDILISCAIARNAESRKPEVSKRRSCSTEL